MGHTRDLSESGLSLVLPAVRLGGEDISRVGSMLRVVLCLPGGIVIVQGETVRCEAWEDEVGAHGYLIGARILRMFEADRRSYQMYLQSAAVEKK